MKQRPGNISWEDRLEDMKAKLPTLQGDEAAALQDMISKLERAIAIKNGISTRNGDIEFSE